MLIIGNHDTIIQTIKMMLTNKFEMKDLDVVDIILGIKVFRISDGLI